jgi:predicted dehydrogenase
MDRRTFSVLLASAPLAAAPGKPVSIAFLGGSHSHAFAKAKILKQSPEWDFRGIWEPEPEVGGRYKELGVRLLSQDEILTDRSVTVVAVESDVGTHGELAARVLEAGKHVHVEKPPAHTMEGIERLVKLAKQKNLLLQSGYMWRHHPGINKMLEAARKGWLGEVYMVRGSISTLIDPGRRPEWGAFAGGHMFELCSHLVDPTARLLGRPEKVTPFLKKSGNFPDQLKDNTVAVFEYRNAMAVIQGATLQAHAGKYRTFEILGTNGTAVLRPIEPPALTLDLAKDAGPYRSGSQEVALPPYKRYEDDFVELAAAVRGERTLSVSLDEEMLVQETLLRASGM